ncbi:FkbM family methyltransferase [Azospirillum doebereinerae]
MSEAPDFTLLHHFLPERTTVVALGADVNVWAAELEGRDRIVVADENPGPLDRWCATRSIRHVDWLALHRGGGALPALKNATELLRLHRIDFIQFDQSEAAHDLPALCALLQGFGYATFRFRDQKLEFFREPAVDDRPCVYFAAAPRHWKRLFKPDASMFRYVDVFPRHGVIPRGVIHIGAHEGEEYDGYVRAGCPRVLFIEADPNTFARLAPRFTGNPDVLCINRAVSDRSGRMPFSRMTGSQSSSLLPPKEHLSFYPGITVSETIEVDVAPLPAILGERGIDVGDYNVLILDTQGAERMILAGCGALLPRFDAVIAEVNYAELYQGCGRIMDIDDLLFPHGFERVEEISPFHHSWGDALYVRRS